MSQEYVVSLVERQKLTANGLKNLSKKQNTNLYLKSLAVVLKIKLFYFTVYIFLIAFM